MNAIQKLLLVSLGLAIANFNLSAAQAKPSHHRFEGESQEDFNQRIQKEKKQKVTAKEELSWSDSFYLKKDGPEKFSKDSFYKLTDGQKITFLEAWMQQGIDEKSINKMSDALDKATDSNIEIDPAIIEQAKLTIENSMKRGIKFLAETSSKEHAREFGAEIKKRSEHFSE